MTRIQCAVAVFVGGVWSVAFLFGILTQNYVALGATTPVVMVIVGAVFTIRNGNGRSR